MPKEARVILNDDSTSVITDLQVAFLTKKRRHLTQKRAISKIFKYCSVKFSKKDYNAIIDLE